MDKKEKTQNRRRRIRVRLAKVAEKSGRLRLTVFRSNRRTSAQIVNDLEGKTIVSADDTQLPKEALKKTKTERAFMIGELIAKKAKDKKIGDMYFDRGAYKYHGRLKAVAEGARKGGIKI